MSDAASTGNAEFIKAAEDAKNFSKMPSTDELLELYALFKQGTIGDNDTTRPGVFDLKGKAKWDAWTGKKGLSKEEAQAKYIAYVKALSEKHA
ncbi:acyl-CoA-binding protein [Piptocephalis cylindrospora]|uniref:Acyl-CoA-binding protein n=1 Tax=Piptocephalis cylindrospora TaxID=1907219 RepID=A0A4P9XZ61_9FUNG|nr:acyl-CoA-binding protein [Piptocephalis cylindrospora]|eukprot:RKP11768.1 acyl-CoA-binding protein [Piptocephalis cylindrospora]